MGFAKYFQLFSDPVFKQILINTGIWFGLSNAVMLVLGVVLATLLNQETKAKAVYRGIIFLPVTISAAVTGYMWSYFYSPGFGPVDSFLKAIGLGSPTQGLLASWPSNIFAAGVMHIWQYTGFFAVVYLAGLQTIPRVLYEAATVDGASRWQKFLSVTLPGLKPMTATLVILSIIGALQQFATIFFLTRGGPAHSSEFFTTYYWTQAFVLYDFGLGATLASLCFFLSMIFAVIYYKVYYVRSL